MAKLQSENLYKKIYVQGKAKCADYCTDDKRDLALFRCFFGIILKDIVLPCHFIAPVHGDFVIKIIQGSGLCIFSNM